MLNPAENKPLVALPHRIDAIVIGASAGAVDALGEILPLLPRETPWPVIVVVHIPANRPSLLASLFARKCELDVREAEDKEPITRGVWFAPADYHLLIEASRTFALSIEAPIKHSRPSIDVLFTSAASVYKEALVGVVLTGANNDGADGARAIRDAGGFIIAQDPKTAVMSAMPEAAIELAEPQWVKTLPSIGKALREAALAGEP